MKETKAEQDFQSQCLIVVRNRQKEYLANTKKVPDSSVKEPRGRISSNTGQEDFQLKVEDSQQSCEREREQLFETTRIHWENCCTLQTSEADTLSFREAVR